MFKSIKKLFSSSKGTNHNIGEELTEKKTTKGGYLLLVVMFFAIISTSQWTIDIIQDIPDKPEKPPYCIDKMIDTFENENYYSYYRTCPSNSLSSSNPQFNFLVEYEKLKDDYKIITNLKQDIRQYDRNKSSIQKDIENFQENYNTSLTEDIAGEKKKIYDKTDIQDKIISLNKELTSIEKNIQDKEEQIASLISKNSSYIKDLKQKYDKVDKKYDKAYLIYRIYVALLSFIFAILVFTIVYKIYSRLKKENSPYTVIFSVASFAYGLILLQISIWFLWDIIPKKILEYVISFLSAFEPAIYILQFIWPVLIIGVFGFIVYKIQKRLYSKENIIKRFIADKKCPNCGNEVDIKKPYCPLCANEIQIKCSHCKELTVKGMPHCSNCGKSLKD